MIPIARPDLDATEKEAVASVIDSGMLADGPEVRSFENEFADYCGASVGVATANGTAALVAALAAAGVGDGDTVLTTPFTFVATANATRLVGATPVFADVDPETFNLDPDRAAEVMREESVDAIIAVHLYGRPAEMDRLRDLADDNDALLVEDAAQAHGATYGGQRVGAIGDVGCFSFYPTKNMTTGEGGMVVTDDEELAERARRYVDHGRVDGYTHATVGHNFRQTSIAAAIGRVQLAKLPKYTERRQENARALTEGLADLPVETPTEDADGRHVYHQYTVRASDRDGLVKHLRANDVGVGVYYPRCVHQQPAYNAYTGAYPAAEEAAQEVLSLPVHPGVSMEDVDRICRSVAAYYDRD